MRQLDSIWANTVPAFAPMRHANAQYIISRGFPRKRSLSNIELQGVGVISESFRSSHSGAGGRRATLTGSPKCADRDLKAEVNSITRLPSLIADHFATQRFNRSTSIFASSQAHERPPGSKRPLQLNQATARRSSHRFSAAHHVHLREDGFHVRFHGAFADEQRRADLLVAFSLGHQFEHVNLARA